MSEAFSDSFPVRDERQKGEKKPERLDVRPEDLEVILHGGVIVTGKLRDLILLRQTLQQDSRYRVVYSKNGNVPLYIVTEWEFQLIQKLKGAAGE